VPNLDRFIEDIQKQLPNLDFESKRLALEVLFNGGVYLIFQVMST
jgi:hypothetical protein